MPMAAPRQQKQIVNGVTQFAPVTMTIPSYQVTFPGGDTSMVTNFEYRIPIVGPVTLAIFADAGIDKLALPSQLKLNPGRIDQLNSEFPQAGLQRQRLYRARNAKDARLHGSGAAGPDAGGERSFPRVLGL